MRVKAEPARIVGIRSLIPRNPSLVPLHIYGGNAPVFTDLRIFYPFPFPDLVKHNFATTRSRLFGIYFLPLDFKLFRLSDFESYSSV